MAVSSASPNTSRFSTEGNLTKDISRKTATTHAATRKILRGTSLDGLFDEWEQTYPPADREGFQRDGIVSEEEFA